MVTVKIKPTVSVGVKVAPKAKVLVGQNLAGSTSTEIGITRRPSLFINQAAVPLKLSELTDIDLSAKTDGSILVYDSNINKFIATTILEKQDVNGGHF